MTHDMSDTPEISGAWVSAAAQAAGLKIAPEHISGVTANFVRIEQIAQSLNALELAPEDEIAPVWTP